VSGASRGRRAVAAVALAFVALASMAPAIAWADETKKPPATSPAAPPTGDVEQMLLRDPRTLVALLGLKFLPALVGLGLLVLELVRAGEVREGVRPPPLPRPPPPTPLPLLPAIGVMAGAVLLPSALVRLVPVEGDKIPVVWSVAATGLAGLLLAGFVLVTRRRRAETGARPVSARVALTDGARTFCVAMLVVLAVGFAAKLLLPYVLPVEPKSQDLVNELVALPLSTSLVITAFGVFVAPFTEECAFRALLLPAIGSATGRTIGVLVSSLLFAMAHFRKPEDVYSVVVLFALAVLLARLYLRTSSILAVFLVHALNNATSLVPLLMLRS
jgi:membrane protease YdiL (CAAX protease family)